VCRWYGLQTVYLVNGPRGWELAGVDVKQRSFARRLLPKARVCPSPDRAIDWADLQTFVPRFTDPALPAEPDIGRHPRRFARAEARRPVHRIADMRGGGARTLVGYRQRA